MTKRRLAQDLRTGHTTVLGKTVEVQPMPGFQSTESEMLLEKQIRRQQYCIFVSFA